MDRQGYRCGRVWNKGNGYKKRYGFSENMNYVKICQKYENGVAFV